MLAIKAREEEHVSARQATNAPCGLPVVRCSPPAANPDPLLALSFNSTIYFSFFIIQIHRIRISELPPAQPPQIHCSHHVLRHQRPSQGVRRPYKRMPQKLSPRRTTHEIPLPTKFNFLKQALCVPTRVSKTCYFHCVGQTMWVAHLKDGLSERHLVGSHAECNTQVKPKPWDCQLQRYLPH